MNKIFSLERVVVLLTPLFAAASAWLTALVANHVPGAPHLDTSSLEGVLIAAFVAICGVVAKWLHGRQIPAIAHPSTGVVERVNAATGDDVKTLVESEVRREVGRVLSAAASSTPAA